MKTPFESPLLRHGWIAPIALAGVFALVFYGANPEEDMEPVRRRGGAPTTTLSEIADNAREQVVAPCTLRGPTGAVVSIPQEQPIIVHVWLQGCLDCMPRFRAIQTLGFQKIDLPVPAINVAYGRVDVDWAERYGLADQLVIDKGSAIVSPLGISSFTTLVIDPQGVVRLADYPEKEGYLERVEAAFKAAQTPNLEQVEPQNSGAGADAIAEAEAKAAAQRREAAARRKRRSEGLQGLPYLGLALFMILVGVAWRVVVGLAAAAPEQAGREAWVEALARSGQRCPQCGGRFTEDDLAVRCSGCLTAYHDLCGDKAEVCSTLACPRYQQKIG